MTTEAELVSQLRALGIPDWDTARWLLDEAAKRIESQAAMQAIQRGLDEILADPVKHGLDLGEKQAAEIERLQDYDTRLSAVMPADFKDWHQNSKNEWPEIAAWVITNLREREAEANAEIERKDALLRQALGALEKTRAFHQQDWSSEETTPKLTRDTIAAIKQHLGEA